MAVIPCLSSWQQSYRSSLCSKSWVLLWPLAENSPVCGTMWSITPIDTSKSCFWPLKTGLILAAAQHNPPGVHWSIPSGMEEKRLWCCLPKTWTRAKRLSNRTQLCESCRAVTQRDALPRAAFWQSGEWCGSTWSHVNPVDRVEPPASGLALKKIYLVTPSCGVRGLQYPEEQQQAVNQGQLLFWSLN